MRTHAATPGLQLQGVEVRSEPLHEHVGATHDPAVWVIEISVEGVIGGDVLQIASDGVET